MSFRIALALLCAALFCSLTSAQAPDEPTMPLPELLADKLQLKAQSGTISLPGGLAQLQLPDDLGYLDPQQTKRVVEDLWGNPPGETYLGMIIKDVNDVLSGDGIAAVITYDNSGHVSDKDAASINYADLLKQMQSGEAEANKERAAQGFPSVHLVGWAESPHYDAGTNKLYWAKEIAFSGEGEHTLNYSIRALGRQGVLELNFVSSIGQLGAVKELAPKVMNAVAFTPGNTYADFNPSTDRVATYGIAALVAGGVAAKAGLFKVLIAALIAGKKLVIIGAIALFAIIGKLFAGRKRTAQ